MEAGGWGSGYTGDGQVGNRKCTTHTHTPQNTGSNPGPVWPAEPSLLLFWDTRLTGPMGGAGLPKRAKKHSIAVDCGELKATFGPRLRCAAVQQVKQLTEVCGDDHMRVTRGYM